MNFLEGRAYRVAEFLTNLVVLNLLWLVACIPLITAFPSTAAMFAVVRDWIRETDSAAVEPFVRHLRSNFWQSLWIGVIWIVLGALLVADFLLIRAMEGWIMLPLYAVMALGLITYALTSVCIFPVMANYESRWQDVIRNSLLISISQLGTSLLCLLLFAFVFVLVLYVPLLTLVAGSATAYIVYFLCARTFARIEALRGLSHHEDDRLS